MQKQNTGNLIKRSRYYQAQIDVSLLEPGTKDFNKLNNSCMILIAPFDLFGRGLYRYTFEGVCRECPDLKLNDGAKRVFINLHGKNDKDFSEEFLEMMRYLEHTTDSVAQQVHSEKIKLIHNRINKIKLSEQMGVKYMQRWEELAYARDDGREEGELFKLITQITKKLQKNKSISTIAEEVEEDLEYIQKICDVAAEFAPEYDTEKILEKLNS